MPYVDIAANRAATKWSKRELAGRLLWALVYPLFALSPRPLWAWRRLLVRVFGGTIGRQVQIYPSVRIAVPWNLDIGDQCAIGDRVILYSLGRITIKERVTISQGAHLCAGTHDYVDPTMPLVKSPIFVDHDAWICADAFLGPGVHVGSFAIVGARSVAIKDVIPGTIVVGNPARVVRSRVAQPADLGK